jgi:nicotinate phosphoribosyltransferase
MDFAKRVRDHTYRIDPIVRSLLDTDMYKLLMSQFLWERYPNVNTTWSVINRTKSIKLPEYIDKFQLIDQLRYVKNLRFTPSELIWLKGQTFYGQTGIFSAGYIDALRTMRLPDFIIDDSEDGTEFELTFSGPSWSVTFWEIYALEIINELLSRAQMATMSLAELDIMYARAKVRLYEDLEMLATLPNLNLTDFGSRRRHGFLWQEHCVLTAKEVLGEQFTGTSNVYLAFKHGLEAKGTNAHELPMLFAALARNDSNPDAFVESQYKVLQEWQSMYHGNMLVFLPDTFGTTQFLANAPQWVANWKGARPDSKEPIEAGEELIRYWKSMGLTDETIAKERLIIFSDGLTRNAIIEIYKHFYGRVGMGFGWGTNFTNNFGGTVPNQPDAMRAISIVCKLKKVYNTPCVKLSDNIQKATGDPTEVKFYISKFGRENVDSRLVTV